MSYKTFLSQKNKIKSVSDTDIKFYTSASVVPWVFEMYRTTTWPIYQTPGQHKIRQFLHLAQKLPRWSHSPFSISSTKTVQWCTACMCIRVLSQIFERFSRAQLDLFNDAKSTYCQLWFWFEFTGIIIQNQGLKCCSDMFDMFLPTLHSPNYATCCISVSSQVYHVHFRQH